MTGDPAANLEQAINHLSPDHAQSPKRFEQQEGLPGLPDLGVKRSRVRNIMTQGRL